MIQSKNLSILLLAFIFLSCRQEPVPHLSLPLITHTGQNTLGFLVENRIWTNYGRRCTIAGCNDNRVKGQFYKQPNGDFILSIGAAYTVTSQSIDQSFGFVTTNITAPGTYVLDSSLGHQVLYVANHYSQFYKNRLPDNFFLTITKFDTTNQIIAGTFKGALYNRTNLADSVIIQDGRFDAQFEYIR
jgi:hypothetical protein